MDLTKYVGKDVTIQLKQTWMVLTAPETDDAEKDDSVPNHPEVVLVDKNHKRTPDGGPCGVPFVYGRLVDAGPGYGTVRMATDHGGEIEVVYNTEVIHSCAVTHTLGKKPVIQEVERPLIQAP